MKLSKSLEGKTVRIVDQEDKVYEGFVFSYIYPDDNAPEEIAEIDIEDCPQCPDQLLGFTEDDIKSLEIIK